MLKLLPTDTCYGLAGDFIKNDYKNIYSLKGRDFSKPLAFLVEDYEDMKKYIEITDEQIQFLRSYPYPWSFLGKRRVGYDLPDFLDAKMYEMISLRVASVCLPALQHSSTPTIHFPLFLTSANPSGEQEAKTLTEARVYFPEIEGIDGGVCAMPPSNMFSVSYLGDLEYLRKNYGSVVGE